MNLKLIREVFDDKSTVGDLLVDGQHECYTLEDKDRKLEQYLAGVDPANHDAYSAALAQLKAAKVYGETCIPRGTYEVAITFSPHFGRLMPLLMNVPGYDGVRIHSGVKPADTLGCILVGEESDIDALRSSRVAFDALFPKLVAACAVGKVLLEIV